MILSQKQIEEIAAAVTEDFNKFFFDTESGEVRMARATPIDQFARDYLGLDVSFTRLSFDGSIEQFVQRVKRNSTLTELTPYALRELVKAVYVDAPDKSSGKRRQKVHIEYDLVGYIPVDELLKAEQA